MADTTPGANTAPRAAAASATAQAYVLSLVLLVATVIGALPTRADTHRGPVRGGPALDGYLGGRRVRYGPRPVGGLDPQRQGVAQRPSTAPIHAPATSRQAKSSASTLEPPDRMAVRTAAAASRCRPSRSRSQR